MITRRSFLTAVAVAPATSLLTTHAALAEESAVLTYHGAAIGGFDPVAYFETAAPLIGDAAHSVEWNDATWHFANAKHKAMFERDPEAFAPKYGGYCSYAAALNYLAPTTYNAWTIHEDRLYLNYSRHVRSIWESDKETYIQMADKNWPSLLYI